MNRRFFLLTEYKKFYSFIITGGGSLIEKTRKRFLWILVVGGLGAAGYLAANIWGKLIGAADVQFVFENRIPFAPEAIIVYLLIFPFLLSPVFLVKKYSDFVLVIAAYGALVFVSFVIFFQFPTTMARPDAPTGGFVGWLFGIMRAIDGPNNLFPSLHVSSVVFVAHVNGFFCPKTKWLSWICAVSISASTLFVKQHAVVDVAGGAIFGAAAYALLRVLRR